MQDKFEELNQSKINNIIDTFKQAEKNADMNNLKSDEYNTITEATKDLKYQASMI